MTTAPVSVSVQGADGYWRQLGKVPGVRYVTAAPGGCAEASIPLSDMALLPDLQQGCPVRVTDSTTGDVLWTGRLSSPVKQVRGILESGDPSFEGQAGFLGDNFVRYTPLVTRLDAWWLGSQMKPYVAGATVEAGTVPVHAANPDGQTINALKLTLPSGYIASPYCSLASFHGFYDGTIDGIDDHSATSVRAFIGWHHEAVQNTNTTRFQCFLWHGESAGSTTWQSNPPYNISQKVRQLLDPAINADLTLGYQYNGPGVDTSGENPAVTPDELWSGWWAIQVFRNLRNKDGSQRIGWSPLGREGLTPDEIINDLIGTFSESINVDPSDLASVIDTTSDVVLTSYDFSAPASMAEILADLNALVPTHFWYVGVADSAGRFPLAWTAWASTRILNLPPGAVTYDEAAGEDDLANVVTYTYTDAYGQDATGKLFADPWAYPDAYRIGGQVEAPPLDLTGLASPLAAKQVATAYLATVATLPKSAKATVTVPVADRDSGAMIPPWALAAGIRAHVPETGETLPVTACEVDADSATAVLTLGTPRRTTEQIVAQLSKHRKRGN